MTPRRLSLLPGLLLAALLALPATAQTAPQTTAQTTALPAASPPPAAAAPREPVSSQPMDAAAVLRVGVGKTSDITVSGDIKDVVVGNPDVADVILRSRSHLFVAGRAAGETSVVLLDAGGKTLRRLTVAVGVDVASLRAVLAQLLPNEHDIQVESIRDSLYLSGSVSSDATARMVRSLARRYVASDAALVNLMRVANDQQVLLHVKVAEIQRSVLKELGLGLSTSKAIRIGGATLTGSTSSTVGLIDSSSNTIFGTATVLGLGSLSASLNMLENQGLIRTLVEPNLTAVSGETATMLAGGELPIPISQINGAISVEFKPYGVLLGFTPTVMDPGRISLKMSTEVSSIDTSNSTALSSTISVPAFKVRRAASTVELPSGGSIMIAGLLQNDINSQIAGLPGLMDLPVLGRLFRSDSFQRQESELVVILSAYVVQAVDRPDAMATPSDGFAPASDVKRLLMGRLQETYTRRGKAPLPVPPELQGPYGYIVE